ncbi:MAG: hypothetical protein JNJ45_12025 [Chthonomonas sp.]|nr:hypothetical protein [Chthonomonas sp.]
MRLTSALGLAAMAALANAQPASAVQMGKFAGKKDFDILHMHTKIGTFKLINGQGRADISFSGSMLVSGYKGDPLVVQGNLRKEFDRDGRTVYFGKGRIILSGSWRAVQWFGQDMQGVWFGNGVIRMRGEFDKDMNTGEYWFKDPKDLFYFPSMGTIDVPLPYKPPPSAKGVTPKKRVKTDG